MAIKAVGLLGPVEAWSANGEPISLGPLRQQAIFAVLALRVNSPVSPAVLVDALWDGHPPTSARQLVHTYVCRLRQALQPDVARWSRTGVLASTSRGYVLALPPNTVDVTLFEQYVARAQAAKSARDLVEARRLLDEALRLWRGEAVAGLSGPLLDSERRRLEERRLLVRHDLFALDLRLGRHHEVLPELSGVAVDHPMSEKMIGLLMLALYRDGRQGEALDVYVRTRQLLVEELGVEPGPALQGLYVRILRADQELMRPDSDDEHFLTASVAGWAGSMTEQAAAQPAASPVAREAVEASVSTPPMPAQLPHDNAFFTGREQLADEIVALISARDLVPVCALAGRPGVGKTALAVHVGHRARAMFPDGQLFLNLGGAQATPTGPAEALDRLVRAVAPNTGQLPDSLDQRAAWFRSVIADKRLLIVLDDARSAEQVGPLLPGSPGSAVLITSRTPLVGLDGARHFHLDSLDESDALRMLQRTIGEARVRAEPDSAAAIIDACAGLPLAIQIAAGKLATRPRWQLRQLADLLGDVARRLDGLATADRAVRSSIAVTEGLLAPAQRHALMLLSLPDVPWLDNGSAAALLDLDQPRTAELLDTLVHGQMLDIIGVGPTGDLLVRFHDLIRLYAQEQAAAQVGIEQRRAAIARIMRRYLGLVAVADGALPLTNDSFVPIAEPVAPYDQPLAGWIGQHATSWLDAEMPHLMTLVRQAAQADLDREAWQLLYKTVTYTLLRSRWDLWRSASEAALACARRAGDELGEAVLLSGIGWLEADWTGGLRGGAELRAALNSFERIGHREGYVGVLNKLAFQLSRASDFAEGLAIGTKAVREAEAIGHVNATADALIPLSYMQCQTGDVEGALESAVRARRIYEALGKPRDVALAMHKIAICHRAVGDHRTAAAVLLECLAIVERFDDLHGQAAILRDLGTLEVDDDGFDAAGYLERCITLFDQLGMERLRGQALYHYGRLLQDRGDRVAATRYLEEARRISAAGPGGTGQQEVAGRIDTLMSIER